MSDLTGSFALTVALGTATAGAKTTFSSFASETVFASQFIGSTNPLTLSVDSPGTLTLAQATPGSL